MGMSIKVNIAAYFQRHTNGVDVAEVNGTTIEECLLDLAKQFPSLDRTLFYEPGDLDDSIAVSINQELFTAWDEPLKKPVADGDELSLLIFGVGGG